MTQNTLNDEIKREETDFVEKGAALEHERWAKWQQYFFSKCQIKPQSQVGGMDDRYVYLALPKDLYEHWQRQIATPYSELSETEKESDRKQVREYLPLLDKICRTIAEKTVEAVRVEGLNEFLEHSTDCILSWYEAGRPTKDGYEQKYRGVWYQSRPIDNTPKCDCGLAELLTEQTNLANRWLRKE